MIINIKINKRIFIFIFILIIVYGIHSCFYSMNNLPKGEYLSSLQSPNKKYTLKSYIFNGGATTAFSIRVELINNDTKKIKNIYWDYDKSEAIIKWLDNDNVIINGKKLNIHHDIYDWRRKR